MDKCEYCGSVLDPQGDAALGKKLDQHVSWYTVESQEIGVPKNHSIQGTREVLAITVIAVSKDFGEDAGNDAREAFIVFVCDGFLMKKKGTVSSYGDVSWNGSCRSAVAREQVKQMWERVQ